MKFSYSSYLMAGTVLLVGLTQFIVLLQIAEFLYPDYSTSQNYISDLGATCKCRLVSVQLSNLLPPYSMARPLSLES